MKTTRILKRLASLLYLHCCLFHPLIAQDAALLTGHEHSAIEVPPSLHASPLDTDSTKQKHRVKLKMGLDSEFFALTYFAELEVVKGLKIGAGRGYGWNQVNLLLYGGSFYSTDITKTYEERDRYGEDQLWEMFWTNVYLRYDFKHFGLQAGYRQSGGGYKNDNSDGDFAKADFKGYYAQASVGAGRYKYACRVMRGWISGTEYERVVILSPLIFSIYF